MARGRADEPERTAVGRAVGSRRPREGWRDLGIAGAFWLLALAVRLLFLHGTTDRVYPFSVFYYGDSRPYREFALAILAGEAYDAGIPFHPPLLAYGLAGLIEAFGARPTLIRGLLAVVAALAVPLLYLLGVRLFSRRVALLSSLLATFSFGLCVTAVSPNGEALYIPLLVAQALAVVMLGDALDSGSPRHRAGLAAVGGLIAGLASLTRSEHLAFLLLAPLALLIGWPARPRGRLLLPSMIMIGAALLVVAPWTWRNYRALSRFNAENPALHRPLPTFALVSSYGPLNFALANHPASRGGFDAEPLVGSHGSSIDLHDRRHLELYLNGYGIGLSHLAADPGRTARLGLAKLERIGGGLALGFGLANWPGGLAGIRRPVDLFVPDRRWLGPVALMLLLAGLWEARRAWRRGSVLGLALLHKLLVALAFYGYARLLVQVSPFIFLLQALALVAWGDRWLPGSWRRLLAGIALAAALLLLLELSLAPTRPRNFLVSGSSHADGTIVQDAELRIEPQRRQRHRGPAKTVGEF